MTDEAIIVFVTTASHDEAAKIGRALVDRRLAACANIIPGITSIYRWEGKIAQDNEFMMILKTRATLFDQLQDVVRALHSYAVPEIIALPITRGASAYLDWITKETITS